MSTATEPTLRCGGCAGDIALPDLGRGGPFSWECPNCGHTNNWYPGDFKDQGPFTTPRSFHAAKLVMDEFDKGSKKVKKAASHIINRMAVLPGMGKSKAWTKWAKKENKRRKRKGLPKLKAMKLKLAKFEPGDLSGYLFPKRNPDGSMGSSFTMPPWFKPSVAVRDTSGSIPPQTIKDFVDEINSVTQPSNDPYDRAIDLLVKISEDEQSEWQPLKKIARYREEAKAIIDQMKEDGDDPIPVTQPSNPDEDERCSPAWYLDNYLASREQYHEELSKDMNGMTLEQDHAHIANLDELLKEMDKAGTIINKLFGSDMVEGVWNHAKDDYPTE